MKFQILYNRFKYLSMHLFICKLFYFICTPIVWLFASFKEGVEIGRSVCFAGFPFFSCKNKSRIKIGDYCRFMSFTYGNLLGLNHRCILAVENNASISIGNFCGFSGVSIWAFDTVIIGNNVRCGANVTIMDGDAHFDDPRSGGSSPIIIEDNVWIGKDVTILKGVRIGKNSLVGANSVVTKSIPANVIAAGNPCRVIRPLTDDVINKLEKSQ